MDVGKRLKSIRLIRNISQRELAKRAGVTNSTISMIEKNSVSPSISSLKKVLNGIPISLVEFFTEENNEPEGNSIDDSKCISITITLAITTTNAVTITTLSISSEIKTNITIANALTIAVAFLRGD